MKGLQFILPYLVILLVVTFFSCSENSVNPESDFSEPEMILINEDLIFTYGPSWDTTFTPPDSLPMPIIELEPFEIGKYEVKNEEYAMFVRDSGYENSSYWTSDGWHFKADENWSLPVFWDESQLWENDPYSNKKNTPVHGISYYEAEAYCSWLSRKTNNNYHIPTSYQWVRAAKGPDPGTKYSWGNEYNRNFANFIPHYPPDTVPLLEVNLFDNGKSFDGCYNMIGNVFEICLIHQVLDPTITFSGYYSSASGDVSSGGDQYYRTMTTISGWSTEKEWRFYALGLRIVKRIN